MGRPSDYTEELSDYICGEIMAGRSMVSICSEDGMPAPKTVYMWLRTEESFRKNYEDAKADQADHFVEEMLHIADTAENDGAQVARLRVDTRKWAASKFKPKKYGDRIMNEHSGTLTFEKVYAAISGGTDGLPEDDITIIE